MAFEGKVVIEGKEYDAIEADYEFKRDADAKGRPSSHVHGMILSCTVESTESTSLVEAAFDEFKRIKGQFIFKKGDERAKMKDIEFEDATIVNFKEHFKRDDSSPMTISLKMTARKVKCGSAVYEAEWPKA